MTPRFLFGLGAGAFVGLVAAAVEHRRLMGQLTDARRSALEDPLTGLANRTGLAAGLGQITGAGQPYALVMLDLDGFKQVNDTLGHDAGDSVLVEVGNRLVDLVDADAVVARLGGDEFVVAAPSPEPGISAGLARDVVTALKRPFDVGVTVPIGVSVGVVHAGAGESVTAVLHSADVAMYRAKAAGGGLVEHEPFAGLRAPETHFPTTRLRDMHGLARSISEVSA